MKLIDLLVKKTAEEGWEWPEGAVEAETFTYEGGLVNFWDEEGHAFEHGFHAFKAKGLDLCEIESVSRSQYEAAIAKNNGWIEWGGGECPVPQGTLVDVRYRCGKENHHVKAGIFGDDSGSDPEHHAGYWGGYSQWDIIAYRLHRDINSRANDNRLEQDLNECIGQDVDPTWNGDGLPPVGTECEIYNRSEWFAVKIKFIGDKWIVAEPLEGMNEDCCENQLHGEDCYSIADKPHAFRPLRTEAEKALDSAKHIIAELCRDSASNGHSADLIIEAIVAGKIPGIKLEGK